LVDIAGRRVEDTQHRHDAVRVSVGTGDVRAVRKLAGENELQPETNPVARML
jgi:hypothetical protein